MDNKLLVDLIGFNKWRFIRASISCVVVGTCSIMSIYLCI